MICPVCEGITDQPHADRECISWMQQEIRAYRLESAAQWMRIQALEAALRPLARMETEGDDSLADDHQIMARVDRLPKTTRTEVAVEDDIRSLTLGDVRLARKLLEASDGEKSHDDRAGEPHAHADL